MAELTHLDFKNIKLRLDAISERLDKLEKDLDKMQKALDEFLTDDMK